MTQLQFNFDKSRAIEIPFPQWVSENQEKLEQAKRDLASNMLSESEKRDTLAELERLKQTPIRPQQ